MRSRRRADPFEAVPAVLREGRIGGLRAAWWEAGPSDGRPLVLVHGGGVDEARISWGTQIGPLGEAGRRIIAPDLPGYGLSEGFRRRHTPADIGAFLVTLFDHLEFDCVDLCGISMGGAAVLQVALDHPSRVRRLVALAPYGLLGTSPHPWLYWLAARAPVHRMAYALIAGSERFAYRSTARLYADPTRIDDPLIPQVMASARRQLRRPAFRDFAQAEMTRRGFNTDLAPRLAGIEVRATIIHGEDDPLIPIGASRRAVAGTGVALRAIPGGHLLPRERPREVREAILRAIA